MPRDEQSRSRRHGVPRMARALRNSWRGLQAAWRQEPAFREEIVVIPPLGLLALVLGADGTERAILVGSLLLILVAELLNSGIEAAVDRAGEHWDSLAERAKDLGSAAVFVAIVNALALWLLVLLG